MGAYLAGASRHGRHVTGCAGPRRRREGRTTRGAGGRRSREQIVQRFVDKDTIIGWAKLRGVYRAGTLTVSQQKAESPTRSQAPFP